DVAVGFVGSLRQWHGIDFFAEAMVKIAKECDHAKFVIVGRGEYEEELRRIVESGGIQNKVQLVGAVPHSEVYPLIAAMDIGVMPDSNEFGSPMKILEYMGMGCVPVGPRLGPIEELIEDGVTGRIFTRRDQDSFVEVMNELLRDDTMRQRISLNAAEHVVCNRTWEINAQDIIDLVHHVAPHPDKDPAAE
ncbi:MAG: glycosyltransferase family 4 protein, partial [Rubripirellula sp.]